MTCTTGSAYVGACCVPAVTACMLMALPISPVDAVRPSLLCTDDLQVGGLADVVTSLAKAHQATGTLVEIVLPKYDCANYGPIDQLRHLTDFEVSWNGKTVPTKAWCGVVEGLPVYMLEPQQPAAFFWRGAFYGQVRHRTQAWSLCCRPGGCHRLDLRLWLARLPVARQRPLSMHVSNPPGALQAP